MQKMKDNKTKQKTQTDNIIFFIILIILFFIPFLISYFFTFEYIERKGPITTKDEAKEFVNILNLQDLNNLYKEKNKNTGNIVILGYHQIRNINDNDTYTEKLFITSPETFEKEMKYLKDNNYTSISITQYINSLKDNIKYKIPKKSIIITFDDGYSSQYYEAYKILKKYNFIATFFIYSDCIDKYPICMKSSELKEMSDNGMLLANHTAHHAFLTDYKDKTIKKEIKEGEEYLKKINSIKFEKVLAYPYGITDNRVIEILKELNYEGAVGVSFFAKDESNIFNLPRYLLGDDMQNFYNVLK